MANEPWVAPSADAPSLTPSLRNLPSLIQLGIDEFQFKDLELRVNPKAKPADQPGENAENSQEHPVQDDRREQSEGTGDRPIVNVYGLGPKKTGDSAKNEERKERDRRAYENQLEQRPFGKSSGLAVLSCRPLPECSLDALFT